MDPEEFKTMLGQIKRKQSEEAFVQEAKRLKMKAEEEKEIKQKLPECRVLILNAINSKMGGVKLPIKLPDYFIKEMESNKIWLSNPTNYRWDDETDQGGGMGFGPASDKSKIISVLYRISQDEPKIPEYSY